jgi:hypothetical protein
MNLNGYIYDVFRETGVQVNDVHDAATLFPNVNNPLATSMTSLQSNHYLRFLQQVHRMTSKGRLNDLEPVCSRLLDEVANEYMAERPLTVTGLMGLDHIASPATLHRKMQVLLREGLIELVVDSENKRSKFVMLSKMGKRRYEVLSSLMMDLCATP